MHLWCNDSIVQLMAWESSVMISSKLVAPRHRFFDIYKPCTKHVCVLSVASIAGGGSSVERTADGGQWRASGNETSAAGLPGCKPCTHTFTLLSHHGSHWCCYRFHCVSLLFLCSHGVYADFGWGKCFGMGQWLKDMKNVILCVEYGLMIFLKNCMWYPHIIRKSCQNFTLS